MDPKPTPYRTVFVGLMIAFFVLLALALCLRYGESGQKMFETAALTLFLLSLPQAVTSSVEKLALGGGVRGAVSALMTATKPGEPPK